MLSQCACPRMQVYSPLSFEATSRKSIRTAIRYLNCGLSACNHNALEDGEWSLRGCFFLVLQLVDHFGIVESHR